MKKSSRLWLDEHFADPYVKQAKLLGYRSRATFKLLELQERDRLFKPGMTVVDLGAAPGGWSQVVKKIVGKKGRVIALDLLAIEPIEGVLFIQGDFADETILQQLQEQLPTNQIDWVISDMSPNLSGIASADQAGSVELAELALMFAIEHLQVPGGFLVKVFQGEGFDAFLLQIRRHFKKVLIRKPKASRGRSREVYILATN